VWCQTNRSSQVEHHLQTHGQRERHYFSQADALCIPRSLRRATTNYRYVMQRTRSWRRIFQLRPAKAYRPYEYSTRNVVHSDPAFVPPVSAWKCLNLSPCFSLFSLSIRRIPPICERVWGILLIERKKGKEKGKN
jgi:hypothetical protein